MSEIVVLDSKEVFNTFCALPSPSFALHCNTVTLGPETNGLQYNWCGMWRAIAFSIHCDMILEDMRASNMSLYIYRR